MKARCLNSSLDREFRINREYDIVPFQGGALVSVSVKEGMSIIVRKDKFDLHFEVLPDDFNTRETLKSIEVAVPVKEKDDIDFFRPRGDAWSCPKCGACRPCSYHP